MSQQATPPPNGLDYMINTCLLYWARHMQPRERSACPSFDEGCGHLHCEYHLLYQVDLHAGQLKYSAREISRLPYHCELHKRPEKEPCNGKIRSKPIPDRPTLKCVFPEELS